MGDLGLMRLGVGLGLEGLETFEAGIDLVMVYAKGLVGINLEERGAVYHTIDRGLDFIFVLSGILIELL